MENLLATTSNGTTDTVTISNPSWGFDDYYFYNPLSRLTSVTSYGNYKIENNSNELVIKIRASGVEKEDIKAHIEDTTLYVKSIKSDFDNINFDLNLAFYNINIKKVISELKNGVLTIRFPKKEKKMTLEIK